MMMMMMIMIIVLPYYCINMKPHSFGEHQ